MTERGARPTHLSHPMSPDNSPHPPCVDLSLANTKGAYYNCRMQTVIAMEALLKAGSIKSWGVSNWQVRDLEQMYAQ